MGKLEDDVKNLKDEVAELKRLLNQVSFNIVRIMGTLEKGVKAAVLILVPLKIELRELKKI
ncbi:MAG: hypothetical protein ACTSRO_09010 [Candidatus Heimdallarchaeaceae archaeon]